MIEPPYGRPWLLFALFGCSLALNLVLVVDRSTGETCDEETAEVGDTPGVGVAEVETAVVSADPTAATASEAVPVPAVSGDWQVVDVNVSHSLARTFQGAVGEDGNALAAVYARLFVWDMDLRRDLMSGDRVEVAWRRDGQGMVEILAARLHSVKLGRTLTAYQYHAPGDVFTSYWQANGTEVPMRLVNGPLKDYQQVTSLLKDRPSHRGMDFKVPEGTQVVTAYAGQVTRTDWNWKSNGNCVEVQHTDGTVAKYLHLSRTDVKPGQRVAAGTPLGLTGNTGRSTAPHLHYQLELGKKTVDPLDYHGTERRTLGAGAIAEFEREAARLDTLFGAAVASR